MPSLLSRALLWHSCALKVVEGAGDLAARHDRRALGKIAAVRTSCSACRCRARPLRLAQESATLAPRVRYVIPSFLPLAIQKESRMEYQYAQAVEILRRTPTTLTVFLRGLPEAWTTSTEGPGTWSAYDIVGHLLHAEEADWIARTRIILEHGEKRPFDSFNRTAMFETYHGFSLDELLATFEQAT